jgi:hypothetical protein
MQQNPKCVRASELLAIYRAAIESYPEEARLGAALLYGYGMGYSRGLGDITGLPMDLWPVSRPEGSEVQEPALEAPESPD